MQIIPYTFRPARFKDDRKGYWVTLFLFFDGNRTHTFYHESDWIDNMCLARECGCSVHNFTYDILVTDDQYSEIFKDIERYVSKPDLCEEL